MAITASHLTHGHNGGASTTGVTASISPGANRLILIAVGVYGSASTPATISATGNGITYTQVAASSAFDDGFGPKRVYLLRGMSASPSSGAITITATGLTAFPYVGWVVTEVDGVDTGGTNGSAAVVQSATNTINGATSITATLAAFASANNGAFGTCYTYGGTAFSPGTGWTELFDGSADDEPQTQWRADNDTTCDWTFGASEDAGAIAIELAASTGGTQSYSYSATGGLSLSGAATALRARALAAAGGLTLAGAAAQVRKVTRAAAGGLTLAGAAAFAKGATVVPAGGITLAGAAALNRLRVAVPAGGIELSGEAGYSTSGSQQFSYSATGGLSLSGSAPQARVSVPAVAGGLQLGGAATVTAHEQQRVVVAGGGITLRGAAGVTTFTLGGAGGGDTPLRRRRRR